VRLVPVPEDFLNKVFRDFGAARLAVVGFRFGPAGADLAPKTIEMFLKKLIFFQDYVLIDQSEKINKLTRLSGFRGGRGQIICHDDNLMTSEWFEKLSEIE